MQVFDWWTLYVILRLRGLRRYHLRLLLRLVTPMPFVRRGFTIRSRPSWSLPSTEGGDIEPGPILGDKKHPVFDLDDPGKPVVTVCQPTNELLCDLLTYLLEADSAAEMFMPGTDPVSDRGGRRDLIDLTKGTVPLLGRGGELGEYGGEDGESTSEGLAEGRLSQELPKPEDKTGVRSILGFMNYYKGLVGEPMGPNYSEMARPLNDLLKKEVLNIKEAWGKDQDEALQKLKDALCAGRCLKPIDNSKPIFLYTDWSIHGIGAVLGQKDD
ncbi:hypothetical protein CYMTET_52385 [Cymbomonas tetramitiformis]|uniref:Reverse transcriptase/retrotransposon-derived protein RNase H-like domain-containing protein n=1 Tax=Cymbomonas tetramitiformis TaxID=36881 RepID=A0AAE0BJ51_9CHLO|nr:hypothetical protein CYMTET_52385 [Cymbomonas tetramitiformis]